MRLLIISHTEHYNDNGVIKGWGPTIREIDHLSQLFDEVIHIAPLYDVPAPASAIAYQSTRVQLRPVKPSGGERLIDKFSIIRNIPAYIRAILTEVRQADVVHIRCPANISLLAVILMTFIRQPRKRWIKYAGNWKPKGREALSYTLQRWWLNRGLVGGVVTVNGQWADQPSHVHSFLNPCLTDEELRAADSKGNPRQLTQPIQLIFVGQLNTAKGVGRLLDVMAELKKRGVSAQLDLVGDSAERALFEQKACALGLEQMVRFHGWLPRSALSAYYAKAHLMIFPTTSSEGWPKVLSEGMAYGVVPIAGNVSSIPQYLQRFGTGRALDPHDVSGFADAVVWYAGHSDKWQQEAAKGIEAARLFSYANYLNAVRNLLDLPNPQ